MNEVRVGGIEVGYQTKIEKELFHSLYRLPGLIKNPHVNYFGCVDSETKQSRMAQAGAIAGGGITLEDYPIEGTSGLDLVFQVRAEARVEEFYLGIHLFCGRLLIEDGLRTVGQQIDRITRFRDHLSALNEHYKGRTHANLVLEKVGTAKPYMDKEFGDLIRIFKL